MTKNKIANLIKDLSNLEPSNLDPSKLQRFILTDKPRININEIDWEGKEKLIVVEAMKTNQDELDKINLVNQNMFNLVEIFILKKLIKR